MSLLKMECWSTPQAGMSESQSIQFTYTIQDPEGLTAEATVVLDFIYQPLHVSQGFSPNGDGSNDYWYIRSIENFPNNQIKSFQSLGPFGVYK